MKKIEFSKKICIFTLVMFTISIIIGIVLSCCGMDTTLLIYLIPAAAGLASISVGFYYNKSKIENLSKQRLRNVLLKIVLEEKLSEEDYFDLCQEIDNIDDTISTKISSMYEDSIDEEQQTEI